MTDADPPSPAESDILPTGALPTAADHPEVKAFLKLHGLAGQPATSTIPATHTARTGATYRQSTKH